MTGEAAFREAMEQWLETALRTYLPGDLICLVPAPLLPTSSRLDLPIDYLGRSDAKSRKAIARFGTVTAIFKDTGSSVFRRIHEFYKSSQPVIVLIREASRSDETIKTGIGRLCVLGVDVPDRDKPHVGDCLADLFVGQSGCVRIPPDTFKSLPEAVEQSYVETSIASEDHELADIVTAHCQAHPFYAPTLAPILPHAHVVMVLARSIHSDDWAVRRRFGAGGVTFLLKPNCKLTDDLSVRMIAVAQRVDGLLGSLHFATEDMARSQAAADALSILKHSVGNHLGNIASLAPQIGPHLTVLKRILHGAVAYARQRGSPIIENEKLIPWQHLGFERQPFDETLKRVLWALKPKLEFSVSGIQGGKLDSRVLVLIEELARNLAKGPEDKPGIIAITCDPITGKGAVRISGWATTWDLQRIVRNLNGITPGTDVLSLRGLEAVVRLSSALRASASFAEFALGEDAIRRRDAMTSPDTINHDLSFRIWDQESYDPDETCYRPFLMMFDNLQLLIL